MAPLSKLILGHFLLIFFMDFTWGFQNEVFKKSKNIVLYRKIKKKLRYLRTPIFNPMLKSATAYKKMSENHGNKTNVSATIFFYFF